MNSADSSGLSIGHLFLVGGFAESAIVQEVVRAEFASKLNVIIPQVLIIVASFVLFIYKKGIFVLKLPHYTRFIMVKIKIERYSRQLF